MGLSTDGELDALCANGDVLYSHRVAPVGIDGVELGAIGGDDDFVACGFLRFAASRAAGQNPDSDGPRRRGERRAALEEAGATQAR